MKFAKVIFRIAGLWGIVALAPLYFMFDIIGRQEPPPVTHPQFFYGFVGVALAWQVAFLIISTDPARFRPMMIPSILEKLAYVLACAVLYFEGRLSLASAATAVPDALLGVLFAISYVTTKTPVTSSPRAVI